MTRIGSVACMAKSDPYSPGGAPELEPDLCSCEFRMALVDRPLAHNQCNAHRQMTTCRNLAVLSSRKTAFRRMSPCALPCVGVARGAHQRPASQACWERCVTGPLWFRPYGTGWK